MFTIDDFFNILKYLQTEAPTNLLETNTLTLSKAEQSNSEALFSSKLDMQSFMSNDYKMLRKFLVDWYSAHKTILTTQRRATDVFSLPKNHLNELLSSFGYNIELNNITRINEANLMLDLVNLYKIKGTPESFATILGYFGMNRLDVSEYYLQKNEDGKLVFNPVVCIQNNPMGINISPSDLDFDLVQLFDPHWMATKEEILALFNNGDITFPIKSPYLGLRPLYYIDKELIFICSILSRKCKIQYDLFINHNPIPDDEVDISILNRQSSLLELYLICDWMIKLFDVGIFYPTYELVLSPPPLLTEEDDFLTAEQNYNPHGDITEFTVHYTLTPPPLLTENEEFLICEQEDSYTQLMYNDRIYRYMGSYDIETEMSYILEEYDEFLKRPTSGANRIYKTNEFLNKFTDSFDNCFLKEIDSAEKLLKEINPQLYNEIAVMVAVGKKDQVLISCMKDLSNWITQTIGGEYSNFASFGLGADTLDYIKNIVNFFKPYRARVLTLDSGFVVHNKLFDSITIEDTKRPKVPTPPPPWWDPEEPWDPDNPPWWDPDDPNDPNYVEPIPMLFINQDEFIVDYDTADSIPGYKESIYESERWIYSKPKNDQCIQIEDLYVNSEGKVKCVYKEVESLIITKNITTTPPPGSYRIRNIYLSFVGHDLNSPRLHVIYDDNPIDEDHLITTWIPSIPEPGCYTVLGMYFNELFQCVIEYGLLDEGKNYYSRNYLDQGSFFDIGASTDWDTGVYASDSTSSDIYISIKPSDVFIVDHIIERYNHHPENSEYYNYCEFDEMDDEIISVRTNGGFTNFDEGWVFDAPFNNDACQIIVTNI